MTLEEFRASLTASEPPPALDWALQALWWEAQGHWDRAQECAQVNEADPSAAWVHAYRVQGGSTDPNRRLVPLTFHAVRERRRKIFRAATGQDTEWIQTGMRHTFCSFWLALHGDVNRLVLQSGHDDADTMWRSYHAGVTEADAEAFWSIRPPAAPANVVALAACS